MPATRRLTCPKCGDELNHHADKLVDPVDARDAALMDPQLGGVVMETHGCAGCGHIELRPQRTPQ